MHKSLHLVTSGKQSLSEVVSLIRQVGHDAIDFLHIREKHLPAQQLVEWITELSNYFPLERLMVNDRVDVAAAIGCGGAHLAYHSLSPIMAKQVLNESQIVGRSTHSLAEAEEACSQGADYIFYGHIYESGSKPDLTPRGTSELAHIVSQVKLPVIAIGGISPERVADVLSTGCAGIAVLSGITSAKDPWEAVKAYRMALDKGGLL